MPRAAAYEATQVLLDARGIGAHVGHPRLLPADEPTSHLDPRAVALALDAIATGVARGMAAVVVTQTRRSSPSRIALSISIGDAGGQSSRWSQARRSAGAIAAARS